MDGEGVVDLEPEDDYESTSFSMLEMSPKTQSERPRKIFRVQYRPFLSPFLRFAHIGER